MVLIGAGMPSILAEIGFLSNPKDESNLNKPDYRQKVAESLYRGIVQSIRVVAQPFRGGWNDDEVAGIFRDRREIIHRWRIKSSVKVTFT